jgi:alanyl-tRNA synthetase
MRQGVRVEFVCGLRAAVTARRDLATLTHAATALSVGRLDVAEAVDRLLAEAKAANKSRQKLTEELAGYHAASLLLQHPLQGDRRLVRLTFTDQDAGYLRLLASRLIASSPQTCALLATTQEEPARVVVAASADLKIDCGSMLREALSAYGLRGGGSSGMAQGQIPKLHLDELFAGLEGRFLNP